MKTRNNFLYNLIKDIYYKNFAYRKYSYKWDKKNNKIEILFGNKIYYFYLFADNRGLYKKSYYNVEEIPFFKIELPGYLNMRKLKEGDSILDIGAFHGGFSVYASKIIGDKGKVFAFEPETQNITVLEKNIKLNNCSNIIPIKKGVWNKEEVLNFFGDGLEGKIDKKGTKKIKVTDIDSELKKRKIKFSRINFVKMDIEGAEIEAIDGMKELLKKGSPFLAIASCKIKSRL